MEPGSPNKPDKHSTSEKEAKMKSEESSDRTKSDKKQRRLSRRMSSITDMSDELLEKVIHPSGLSRRLSEVDILTKVEIENCLSQEVECEENGGVPEPEEMKDFTRSNIDKFTRIKSLKTIGCNITKEYLDPSIFEKECENVSKVLVLYTGGTIGMRADKGIYRPQPNYFVKAIRKLPMFHDTAVTNRPPFSNKPMESLPLIMPLSPEARRVVYVVYEYDPIIDSSDMTMDDWITVGRDIENEYANFDGFVVLHGTDTLSYTASALSFILENLGKPVVVTGSQIPIFETRSDGRDNFLGALIVAGHCLIPEVCVYFHNQLFRACRVTKASTVHFDAFDSPNFPAIVEFGVLMHVRRDLIFKPYSLKPMTLCSELCPNVTIVRLFPSIPVDTVRQLVAAPIQGAVIQSFGAGNVPSSRFDLITVLTEAANRGCLLINISQCPRGPVKPIYEGGARLREIGVLCGGDMTPEAALTKLAYVLGKSEWSLAEKRWALERSLRGEITAPRRLEEVLTDEELLNRLTSALQLSSIEEARHLRNYLLPSIMCAAAKEDKLDDLKRFTSMIEGQEDWQIWDYDRRTPLHLAASEGNVECVLHLLRTGALVHQKDRFGTTPLLNAVMSRHPEIIKVIKKTGGQLNMSTQALGTELYKAASTNDVELLKLFYMAGATLLCCDPEGRSIMHAAAFYGHKDVVQLLTETLDDDSLAEISTKLDGLGLTPYDVAVKRDNVEIKRLLYPYQSSGSLSEHNR